MIQRTPSINDAPFALPGGGITDGARLRIGFVVETFSCANPRNKSKLCTEYSVDVVEQNQSMVRYEGCIGIDTFGDQLNFLNINHRTVTEPSRAAKDQSLNVKSQSVPWKYKNGALVLLLCIEGRKDNAVILGGIQHPAYRLDRNTDVDPAVSEFVGVGSSGSRDDRVKQLPLALPGIGSGDPEDHAEPTMIGEFNGLRWNINNDGELTMIFQGPKNADGTLKDTAVGPTVFKIDREGNFFILDNLDQEIRISRTERRILISTGDVDSPAQIVLSRDTRDVTISGGSLTINVLGDANIKCAKNASVSAGKDASVKAAGKINVESGQAISMKAAGAIDIKAGGPLTLDGTVINIG